MTFHFISFFIHFFSFNVLRNEKKNQFKISLRQYILFLIMIYEKFHMKD